MKVYGTVTTTFSVELDAKSIHPRDISIKDSNELIKKAIEDKYEVKVKGDICVKGFKS
ncbi:hypothetical protein OCA16_01805 [Bacillus cereus]|uniref:hypothetical protein n=1 Tax=Bacillus thuringiensis TaxID=1428 RepID=UPI001416FB93|nr:hypothetical protein [Bacillus thuringiensis]MCU5403312.1 hypothetical protein [Bacillus cereus]MDA2416850.1 hypothetical protein [Bacillus cereus]